MLTPKQMNTIIGYFSFHQNAINKLNAGEQRECISLVLEAFGLMMSNQLKEGDQMAKKKTAKKVKTVKPTKKAW